MKRLLPLLLAFIAPALAPASAAAAEFDAFGKYEEVSPAQPTATKDKVEVLELFWYGCPHCFRFHPFLERWKETKPDYVEFRMMPTVFRPSWEAHAKAYFTAELLGVVDKVHEPLFDAMHMEKRKLNTREELADFFQEHGVSKDDFYKTYDSFAVTSMVKRATVMSDRYGVNGVPAVIINGKYRTSGSLAGSYDNVLKVIDALVDKEHKAAMASR